MKTYSALIFLVTVPITIGLVLFSHPLVRILFERGAFSAEDTKVVSGVQTFLSMQIPFYMLGTFGVRLLSALKKNVILAVISGVNAALNITLNYVLMRSMGVAGIALSTSLVYLLSCCMVYGCIFACLPKEQNQVARK